MHDVRPIDTVQALKKTEEVVLQLLALFARYDTHVTWATVGLLANKTVKNILDDESNQIIPYTNTSFSPFPISADKYGDFDPALLIGSLEISAILTEKNQELASHTYSHFYCAEEGVSSSDFKKDLDSMSNIAEEYKNPFKSIVFPRNQVNTAVLSMLKAQGYLSYRGNQENRYWKNSQYEQESFFKKMMRVVDAYYKISKTSSYKHSELKTVEGLINIPASRFFRPHSGKNWLEKRKIKRIKREMKQVAQNETVYHLWWHPHNFTHKTEDCLGQIEELLAYQRVLLKNYGFESLNMSEIAEYVKS